MTTLKQAAAILMQDATQQAQGVSNGEYSTADLLSVQASETDRLNPMLNAFVHRLAPVDVPADVPFNPLRGVSFAVKDNIDVAGLPSHSGLRALAAAPAAADAPVVARLRTAGLVLTGKLNMSPVALGASNHNDDFGNCFNPLRAGYSPGGSSGGAASAVAAGLVSVALGTDTMGSVRLPAAWCGVVGFKPSWGHIPTGGVLPLCSALDHVGVLARSVRDVCHAYGLLSGRHDDEAISRRQGYPVLGLPVSLAPLGLEPAVATAFSAACATIEQRGYPEQRIDFADYPFATVRRAALLWCEAELLNTLGAAEAARREQLPAALAAMLGFAAGKSAADLARALSRISLARQWLEAALTGVDCLLLPTCPGRAMPMSEPEPSNTADLAALANILGAPAISLPLPVAGESLPAALQLIGRPGQDHALLEMAESIAMMIAPDAA